MKAGGELLSLVGLWFHESGGLFVRTRRSSTRGVRMSAMTERLILETVLKYTGSLGRGSGIVCTLSFFCVPKPGTALFARGATKERVVTRFDI